MSDFVCSGLRFLNLKLVNNFDLHTMKLFFSWGHYQEAGHPLPSGPQVKLVFLQTYKKPVKIYFLRNVTKFPAKAFKMLLFQAGARGGPAKWNYGEGDLALSPLLPAHHQRRPARPSCRQGRCGRPTLWPGAWGALWDLAHCLCQVLSWTHSLEDLSGVVIWISGVMWRWETWKVNAEDNILPGDVHEVAAQDRVGHAMEQVLT